MNIYAILKTFNTNAAQGPQGQILQLQIISNLFFSGRSQISLYITFVTFALEANILRKI